MTTGRRLPWCKGPKLALFPLTSVSSDKIEILEILGEGLHAEVYRARIAAQFYAIKVFRFFRASELCSPRDLEMGYVSVDEVLNQVDPFHAECRAYGRLKETGNEHLAVPCHGYLHINSAQEQQIDPLRNRFHRDKWNQRQPLRAVVKDLIAPTEPNFTFDMIPRMQRDMRALNKLGIVVFDLRSDNYLGGRIADFSQAHTTPHHLLDLDNPDNDLPTIRELCARDFCAFDGIMDSWNEQHPNKRAWNRFFPNKLFGRRLRNSTRYDAWYFDQDEATLDAARYDWKRIKKRQREKCLTETSTSKVAKRRRAKRKPP